MVRAGLEDREVQVDPEGQDLPSRRLHPAIHRHPANPVFQLTRLDQSGRLDPEVPVHPLDPVHQQRLPLRVVHQDRRSESLFASVSAVGER